MPCTFYTAPGSKGSPPPSPPQQEKFSSQNEARRWEFASTLPRGCSEQLGRCLDHLVCAQMGKERAFRHRSPSEWAPGAKEKPICFIKNHRVSYSHDPLTHSHLALGTNFLKLGSFPVTQFPTWNPSMLPRNLQDMAWHSSLHGIWPQGAVHCHLWLCIPPGPQTANSLRISRSGPFLSSTFSSRSISSRTVDSEIIQL